MILKRFKQIILFVALATVIVSALTAILWFSQQNQPHVEVVFLDVGQGDSILIKTKYNQQILIDGGPDANVLGGLGRHLPFYDRDLDMVIATHPDADHIAGLVSVVDRYNVGLFLQDGVAHDTAVYQTLLAAISRKNIVTRFVAGRQIYDLGDNLHLDVLYPDVSFVGQDINDNNVASIVARLTDGRIDYLLTGDAPEEVESKLITRHQQDLPSEILKLGHHGSKTSSSHDFLKIVSPEVGVVSVGRNNRYGHPSPIIIRRLEQLGIPVLRTDEMGDISFVSSGEFVELR